MVRMVELECQRCGREWDYGGSRHYATCPNCKTSVKAGELPSEEPAEEITVDNPLVEGEQTVPEALDYLVHTVEALWEENGKLQERVAELEDTVAGEQIGADRRADQVGELYDTIEILVEELDWAVEFDHAPGDRYDPPEDLGDE